MSASSIRRSLLHRGHRERLILYSIPLTANHRRLRFQRAHEHRAWQVDWHQVVFWDESRFNFWDQGGRVRVWRNTYEHRLLECVTDQHLDWTPGAREFHKLKGWPPANELFCLSSGVWFRTMEDPICYELRVISLATGTSGKCYSPKSFPFFIVSQEPDMETKGCTIHLKLFERKLSIFFFIFNN